MHSFRISRHFGSTDPNVGYFSFSAEIGDGNLRKLLFIGTKDSGTMNIQQNMIRKAAKHSEYVKGLGIEVVLSKVDHKEKRL